MFAFQLYKLQHTLGLHFSFINYKGAYTHYSNTMGEWRKSKPAAGEPLLSIMFLFESDITCLTLHCLFCNVVLFRNNSQYLFVLNGICNNSRKSGSQEMKTIL